MNLDISTWKEYKISDLFNIKYGVNLELNACEEVSANTPDSVNFVARTAENNGISARVKLIEEVAPQKAGLISVAGGGSVLSTFLQYEPFYSGRDLYVLEAKEDITNEAKLFIATVIEQNKYKYSYGRQANKTLPDILLKLPTNRNGAPDYTFMSNYIKSLHHKPLTTKNIKSNNTINIDKWYDFEFGKLISKIYKAKAHNKDDLTETNNPTLSIRYITRTAENNGCELIVPLNDIDGDTIEEANAITIGDTTATCFYQDEKFIAGDHMVVVRAEWLNKARALFILSILKKEQYKYSYGRAFLMDRIKSTTLKLPIVRNDDGTPYVDETHKFSNDGYVPDWTFMENYIKSLPYGDRI